MEHDEPRPVSPPIEIPPPAHFRPVWSAVPFSGSPNTAFVVTSASGITTSGPPLDSPARALSPGEHGQNPIWSPAFPTTKDFVEFYDASILITDLLMVSFIPDDIAYLDFCSTMSRIQRHLQVLYTNDYYMDESFASKFPPLGSASWADEGFSYPEERHNTYLLRLGGPLPFTHGGRAGDLNRPMVFSLPVSPVLETRPNRWLVIQPVPSDFADLYLRPPIVVWRGIGLDANLGNAAAARLLIDLYVTRAMETWQAEDPNCRWSTYSYISTHKIDIKAPPKPARNAPDQRRFGRGSGRQLRPAPQSIGMAISTTAPSDPGGPLHAQYGELFVLTVCTAPTGMLARCFEYLTPPTAAFGLPTYPLRLCGWWLEMARGIDTLRTNEKKIAPGLELLSPCPVTRIKGIKPGATLGKIISALGTEDQNTEGILAGYLHRATGGDTCILLSQGPLLFGTTALRPLASSHSPVEDSDIEDLKKLRERYGIFRRSLGLPTSPPQMGPGPPLAPSPPTLALVRPRAGTAPTFAEIVRSLPGGVGEQLRVMLTDVVQQEVAAATRLTTGRVEVLEAAQRQTEATQTKHTTAITTLEATTELNSSSIVALEESQETLHGEVQEARQTATTAAATVDVHTRSWKDLNTFLDQNTEDMDKIKSKLQTLLKRRGTGWDPDGPTPPPSPNPDPHF